MIKLGCGKFLCFASILQLCVTQKIEFYTFFELFQKIKKPKSSLEIFGLFFKLITGLLQLKNLDILTKYQLRNGDKINLHF